MSAKTQFMARLIRECNATAESFLEDPDNNYVDYVIRFSRVLDERDNFVHLFNESGLFTEFDIRYSGINPILYVEFRND